MNMMTSLPVRRCSIVCVDHPEWGTFGVMEDRGDHYEILGDGGPRVLSKHEAQKFWALANVIRDEPEPPYCAHEWVYTGTAYGGDDERWCGEGRVYCSKCGADGDA